MNGMVMALNFSFVKFANIVILTMCNLHGVSQGEELDPITFNLSVRKTINTECFINLLSGIAVLVPKKPHSHK